ncbi:MAG: hypothetical protein HY516_00150 [Candidatus Aenigmarchaeota archaeon]|nr:hypothetical protein [Candidatus Aenigmarchaeota archaeon]
MEDVSKRDTCSSINVIGDKTLALETSYRTGSSALTPFVGTGNFDDFRRFADQHGLGAVYEEIAPYAGRLPNWLGVKDGSRILAITPYQDDSADFGRGGNRRVKPSSEITPFAVDPEAAKAMVGTWERSFSNATRYGNIRVPAGGEDVQKRLAVVGVSDALKNRGYVAEAKNAGLYFVGGHFYDVEDFAKVDPERRALFPERDEEWFKAIKQQVESRENNFNPALAKRVLERVQETHMLRQAQLKDVSGLVYVLKTTFPFYGTYPLDEAMPKMVAAQFDGSPTPSLVYVAERIKDGKIDATVTVERSPFRFGELTDVAALDPDTGHVKTNGTGFSLSYMALRHAARMGMRTWWTDAVPAPEMNSLANKLGGEWAGQHVTTVKLLTRQIKERHFPNHDPLVMDLFVHNGPLELLEQI